MMRASTHLVEVAEIVQSGGMTRAVAYVNLFPRSGAHATITSAVDAAAARTAEIFDAYVTDIHDAPALVKEIESLVSRAGADGTVQLGAWRVYSVDGESVTAHEGRFSPATIADVLRSSYGVTSIVDV